VNNKQVGNWRNFLSSLIGSRSFALSKEEIVTVRNDFQETVDRLGEEIKERNNCDGECSKCEREESCDF